MERWKRNVGIALLIVIIIGALLWILKSAGLFGKPGRHPSVGAQLIEKVDIRSGELMVLPLKEWENIGLKGHLYKNPETGEHTMDMPVVCGSCGAKIPPPQPPPGSPPGDDLGLIKLMLKYKCPKCGGPVVPPAR